MVWGRFPIGTYKMSPGAAPVSKTGHFEHFRAPDPFCPSQSLTDAPAYQKVQGQALVPGSEEGSPSHPGVLGTPLQTTIYLDLWDILL